MDMKAMSGKKVAGIPVVYLAAGFVVILVAIAWKTKSIHTGDPEATAPTADTGDLTDTGEPRNGSGGSSGGVGGDVYPNMPSGTVIVAPVATQTNGSNSAITDNDEWLRRGVTLLIGRGKNPGSAQSALTLYLAGSNLTYEQGEMRDIVVREFGIPPYAGDVGATGPKPVPVVAKVAPSPTAIAANIAAHKSTLAQVNANRVAHKLPPLPRLPGTPAPVKPLVIPKPAPPNGQPRFPGNVRTGTTGKDVVTIQKRLGVPQTGKYDDTTYQAVKRFQTSHRLASDGVVAALTWKAMF